MFDTLTAFARGGLLRFGLETLLRGPAIVMRVLAVLLPSAAYVALLLKLGIYVASALFLIGFMRQQGKYRWSRALLLGVSVPVAMFALFEIGFGLPLPKGPLEGWLGY